MTEYQGQPEYVKAGFLSDIFEPWLEILPGDEWGEYLQALHQLGNTAVGFDEQKAITVFRWFEEEINRLFEEQLLEDYNIDPRELSHWRSRLPEVIEYWRDRAKAFKGSEILEQTINELPKWMFPTDEDQETHEPVVYTTKTGRTLTETEIEALAKEMDQNAS